MLEVPKLACWGWGSTFAEIGHIARFKFDGEWKKNRQSFCKIFGGRDREDKRNCTLLQSLWHQGLSTEGEAPPCFSCDYLHSIHDCGNPGEMDTDDNYIHSWWIYVMNLGTPLTQDYQLPPQYTFLQRVTQLGTSQSVLETRRTCEGVCLKSVQYMWLKLISFILVANHSDMDICTLNCVILL